MTACINNDRRHGGGRTVRRGFTLIEAIVVIVIIGVLASVIAPPLIKHIVRSKQAAAEANAATIADAVKLYWADYGSIPEDLQSLLARTDDGKGHGPYLDNAGQLIDPWGHPFHLRVPPVKNSEFDIISYGADGTEGGTGDNADIVKP